jgi:hypothetical protein
VIHRVKEGELQKKMLTRSEAIRSCDLSGVPQMPDNRNLEKNRAHPVRRMGFFIRTMHLASDGI